MSFDCIHGDQRSGKQGNQGIGRKFNSFHGDQDKIRELNKSLEKIQEVIPASFLLTFASTKYSSSQVTFISTHVICPHATPA